MNVEYASDGTKIYPEMSAIAYGYDGSGNLITETITQYSATWVKTYTWSDWRTFTTA